MKLTAIYLSRKRGQPRSLLEIVVANYGTERETIVHADLLRDKFKQQMDRALPGWRVTWET